MGSASGTFETDSNGRRYFRPNPPVLPRLEEVQDALRTAELSVYEFDRLLADRPQEGSIGRLFARLDAVHSSGAEGSTTTFTDLMEFETSARTAPDVEDAAAVAACAAALEMDENNDLSSAALNIHRRLFESARNRRLKETAGRPKSTFNATADPDEPGGYFYYTRPDSVRSAMVEWQDFTMKSDPAVPELVRQIASHWMFEHIHPVADGNGRIGRLLVPMTLKLKGATKSACAFLGEAVYENKQLYVEALKGARISSDWTAWTRLMLDYIAATAKNNIDRFCKLAGLAEEWKNATARFRSDSQVHKLARFALTNPVFTVNDVTTKIGGTFASNNIAVGHLVDVGILTPASDAKRDRIFHADAVLLIFDRFKAEPTPAP
jgi:Fic family protein